MQWELPRPKASRGAAGALGHDVRSCILLTSMILTSRQPLAIRYQPNVPNAALGSPHVSGYGIGQGLGRGIALRSRERHYKCHRGEQQTPQVVLLAPDIAKCCRRMNDQVASGDRVADMSQRGGTARSPHAHRTRSAQPLPRTPSVTVEFLQHFLHLPFRSILPKGEQEGVYTQADAESRPQVTQTVNYN